MLAPASWSAVATLGATPLVASRTAFSGLSVFFRRSTAVSSMQGALASLPPHATTLRDSAHVDVMQLRMSTFP
jgi:hypothetical protein